MFKASDFIFLEKKWIINLIKKTVMGLKVDFFFEKKNVLGQNLASSSDWISRHYEACNKVRLGHTSI